MPNTDAVRINPSIKEITTRILAVVNNPEGRKRLLLRAVLELKDLAAGYPVEGAWNRDPGTKGNHVWYQRQFGTRYKRKDGSTGGRNTSQRLQKSWQTEVQRRDDFSASAFTDVTYAPYLLDPERRVSWAAGHGWQDLDTIQEQYTPRFEQLALDEVDDQIDKI
jgi:hypothetical protein